MKSWSNLKKTLVIFGVIIAGSLALSGGGTQNNLTPPSTSNAAVQSDTTTNVTDQQTITPVNNNQSSTATSDNTDTTGQNNLSNNNSYTNVDGDTVHSPAYSEDNSIPSGATAQCADGTYSFSEHRQGTCSHHGGVITWY